MITIELFYSRFTCIFIIYVINAYSKLIKFNSAYGLSMTRLNLSLGVAVWGNSVLDQASLYPTFLPGINLTFFNFFIGSVIGFRAVTFL